LLCGAGDLLFDCMEEKQVPQAANLNFSEPLKLCRGLTDDSI